MRISDYIVKNKKALAIIAFVAVAVIFIFNQNNSIITRGELNSYRSLDKKIQELEAEISRYDSENYDKVSDYLDLRVKYEEIEQSFNEYKGKYPDDLAEEVEQVREEVSNCFSYHDEEITDFRPDSFGIIQINSHVFNFIIDILRLILNFTKV